MLGVGGSGQARRGEWAESVTRGKKGGGVRGGGALDPLGARVWHEAKGERGIFVTILCAMGGVLGYEGRMARPSGMRYLLAPVFAVLAVACSDQVTNEPYVITPSMGGAGSSAGGSSAGASSQGGAGASAGSSGASGTSAAGSSAGGTSGSAGSSGASAGGGSGSAGSSGASAGGSGGSTGGSGSSGAAGSAGTAAGSSGASGSGGSGGTM